VRPLIPLLWLCASLAQATDYALQPALPVMEPASEQLLDIARAGDRLVAAGERGLIIWSDDEGRNWQQAKVPVSETLTALSFPSADHGWAVGHGGVILHTGDGGETWQQQFDGNDANRQRLDYVTDRAMALEARLREMESEPDDELQWQLEELQFAVEDAEAALDTGPADPFLDVWFADENRGWAVGAYGMIFRPGNGGLQWRIAADSIVNWGGYHYYSLASAGGGLMYLSGEAGLLYRSENGGDRWERIDLDYYGSLFGVLALDDRRAITFGLRGNIYLTEDRGESWRLVTDEDSPGLSFYGGRQLTNGSVVLVGAGGVMASSRNGENFTAETHSARNTFSQALSTNNELLLVGMGGLTRIPRAREQAP
jgi:photosystem II stability/assembly factor-like uncharacterized protein